MSQIIRVYSYQRKDEIERTIKEENVRELNKQAINHKFENHLKPRDKELLKGILGNKKEIVKADGNKKTTKKKK